MSIVPAERTAPAVPVPAPNGLAALHQRLRAATTVAELFRLGAREVCIACDFERGVVASVDAIMLTAEGRRMTVASEASDELSRRLVAEPVTVVPASAESWLIRDPSRGPPPGATSVLQAALGLDEYALVPIVPENQTVALLVVDRRERHVTSTDLQQLSLYASTLAVELERLVLRTRVNNLANEVRNLSTSVEALVQEALTGPVSPRPDASRVSIYTQTGYVDHAQSLPDQLTKRDIEIGQLLCAGRSNQEIGKELFVSPETVKDQLGRLARKLDARNRVEAAARFAALRTRGQSDATTSVGP